MFNPSELLFTGQTIRICFKGVTVIPFKMSLYAEELLKLFKVRDDDTLKIEDGFFVGEKP